jgi:hypothetical protein
MNADRATKNRLSERGISNAANVAVAKPRPALENADFKLRQCKKYAIFKNLGIFNVLIIMPKVSSTRSVKFSDTTSRVWVVA